MKTSSLLWAATTTILVLCGSPAWTEETAWSPRSGHGMASFKDMLVVIGGFSFEGGFFLNDVWMSDNGVDWTRTTPAAPHFAPRQQHGVVVFQEQLWVLGGQSGADLLHDVWRSSDGENWTQVVESATWTPRRSMACAVHGEYLYLTGGETDEREYLNDVWRTSDGEHWELVSGAAAWSPRGMHALVSFKDALWLLGGASDYELYREVWRSADGQSWTQADAPPFTLAWLRAEVFKESLYVLGGISEEDRFSNRVYRTRDGVSWSSADEVSWQPRSRHGAAVYKRRLWIAGGVVQDAAGEADSNDLWYTRDGDKWLPASEQGLLSCLGCGTGCDKRMVTYGRRHLGDWLLVGFSLMLLVRFSL